eukprot:scaffold250190_cov27-Tisochrysis_lutea.AAC.3
MISSGGARFGGSGASRSSHGCSNPGMRRLPVMYADMPAPTREPRPVAWVSRSRPPVPVSAPGKGATPEGKLCVSAVRSGWDSSLVTAYSEGPFADDGRRGFTWKPRMEDELSWKAMTELSTTLGPLSVALTI